MSQGPVLGNETDSGTQQIVQGSRGIEDQNYEQQLSII